MTYYDINSFRWTEREYSLKEIVEEYSSYLPFAVLVTEGYSSRHVEITADQIFWIHEITTRPCVIVKDGQGRYFSIPESFQSKVVPLRQTASGRYAPTSKPLHLSQLKDRGWCQYFRLLESSSEVFDGLEDSQLMKMGCLEIRDTFQEKLLVGYPILSEPDTDEEDTSNGTNQVNAGAIYPQVTLIPVYLPLVVRIALSTNNISEDDFFKTMRQLKKLADGCSHDYRSLLESDTEIMMFNEAPTNHVYDYIQMEPFLKKSKKSKEVHNLYTDIADDSSDSSYEQIPDCSDTSGADRKHKLRYREEPIAKETEMEPRERLAALKDAYATCTSESGSDCEDSVPPLPPKIFDDINVPPVPQINKKIRPRTAAGDRSKPTSTGSCSGKCRKDKVTAPGEHGPTTAEQSKTNCGEESSGNPSEENGPRRRLFTGREFQVPRPPQKHAATFKPKYQSAKPVPPPPTSTRTEQTDTGATTSVKPSHSDPPGRTAGPKRGMRRPKDRAPTSSGPGRGSAKEYPVPSPGQSVSKSLDTTSPVDSDSAAQKHFEGSGITSISDIPADISELSVPQVMDCLRLLGMSRYVPAMKRSFVDGDLLCCLDENTLAESFGFTVFDAKKILRFCKGWRPKIE